MSLSWTEQAILERLALGPATQDQIIMLVSQGPEHEETLAPLIKNLEERAFLTRQRVRAGLVVLHIRSLGYRALAEDKDGR